MLKVRQIRNDFFKSTFLLKNERTNSTLLLVDLFSFVFWKKVKTQKRDFEINRPLGIYNEKTFVINEMRLQQNFNPIATLLSLQQI